MMGFRASYKPIMRIYCQRERPRMRPIDGSARRSGIFNGMKDLIDFGA